MNKWMNLVYTCFYQNLGYIWIYEYNEYIIVDNNRDKKKVFFRADLPFPGQDRVKPTNFFFCDFLPSVGPAGVQSTLNFFVIFFNRAEPTTNYVLIFFLEFLIFLVIFLVVCEYFLVLFNGFGYFF